MSSTKDTVNTICLKVPLNFHQIVTGGIFNSVLHSEWSTFQYANIRKTVNRLVALHESEWVLVYFSSSHADPQVSDNVPDSSLIKSNFKKGNSWPLYFPQQWCIHLVCRALCNFPSRTFKHVQLECDFEDGLETETCWPSASWTFPQINEFISWEADTENRCY